MTAAHLYKQYPSLRSYDRLGVPWMLTGERWDGPLWTGHHMVLSTTDSYGDQSFCHELFHWMVATPKQRRHADFALGRQVNASPKVYAASWLSHDFDGEAALPPAGHNAGWGELTVSRAIAGRQENLSCFGMFLYAPLHGLESWKTKAPNLALHDAAYDFSGGIWGDVRLGGSLTQWRQVHKRIVQPLDPKVGFDTMIRYVERIQDQNRDEVAA